MIKNIIFDLGGVFIRIHYQKTSDAFKDLGITNFDDFFKQDYVNELFENFEKGLITPLEFYNSFRQLININVANDDIKNAWNAMLGSFWQERLNWLEQVKSNFNIYLFSNTNKVHYDAFMNSYKTENPSRIPLNEYFIKAYYSQNIHLRKPNLDSYQYILHEQKLIASETLFIDDTIKNIEGAKAAGLKTFHLTNDIDLTTLNLSDL